MTSTDNARAALLGTDTEEGALDLDRPAGDGTPYSEGIVEGYSQAVNVVRATLDRLAAGRAETTTDDCPECGDNYCRCGIDWTADPRAETTTATDEDMFEQAWEVVARVRDAHPRRVDDAPTEDIVDALIDARLLATARTRPTLSSIAGKLADEMGCERTRDASTGVNFCATHYVGWLSDTDQCARAERLADAVLALLNNEGD